MEKVITLYFVFTGSYQFKLAVKDKDNNEDSNFVSVTVTQDSNAAPVAQAGTDVEVILPQSVVIGDLVFSSVMKFGMDFMLILEIWGYCTTQMQSKHEFLLWTLFYEM